MSKNDFRIQHDQIARMGLKHPKRFKDFIKFSLAKDQFNAFEFNRLEFIKTDFLDQKLGGRIEECRSDVIAKVGVKGMKMQGLVGVIIEHKSFKQSQKQLFLNVLDYNVALLKSGTYPVMTIFLLHNDASSHTASDLQGAFNWTPEMRKVFGDLGLNFGVIVIDLNKISEDDIWNKAGSIAALCYALKFAKNMTKDKIRSILKLCRRDSEDVISYREYAGFLSEYMFQTADYPKEILYKIEQEIITNKEEIIMPSTYSRAIQEGMEKGMEKGREEGMEKGMERGMEKGMERGMEKGRQEGLKEVALNLLKSGHVDIQAICKATGLSKQEVSDLQKA